MDSFEEKMDLKPKESKHQITQEINYIEMLEMDEKKRLSSGKSKDTEDG